MLTLTSTLMAAQKQGDRSPVITVLVADVPVEAARLGDMALVYAGGEPDAVFDAAATSVGTVVRAYVSGTTVYAQVASAGSPSQFGVWVVLDAAAQPSHVAVRASGSDGSAEVFWVASNGTTIRYVSFNGSTWDPGGPYSVVDVGAGNAVGGLASSGGDATIRLFYAVNPPTPGTGWIAETHNTGGTSWSAPVQDSEPRYPVSGIGADLSGYDGNSYVVIVDGSPARISLLTWGPGAAWGSGSVLVQTFAGSGYSYSYPRIQERATAVDRAVITWSEVTAFGLVDYVCFTPTDLWLTEVVPWRYGEVHGARVFRSAVGTWWLCSSSNVYSCPADTRSVSGGQRIAFDIDDVADLELEEPRPMAAARGTVTLENVGGALAGAGQAGAYLGLRPWSQVAIGLGYHTTAGDETAWQTPYWIDAVEFHDEIASGEALVTLHLVDAWGFLERFVVRSQTVFTGQTLGYIVQRIWWRVCGRLESDPNALMDIVVPTFTLSAGETYGAATRRLCETAGVVLRFRTSATAVDGTAWDSVVPEVVAWSPVGAASVYSYGPAGHPMIRAAPASTVASAGHVEVFGAGYQGLARSWLAVHAGWHDVPAKVVDRTLTSQAAVNAVSAQLLALYGPEVAGGEIETWVNVGLQVGDVIDLTVASAGLAAATRVVFGVRTKFDRSLGDLRQVVLLQGVGS